MKIRVNGRFREFEKNKTLQDFINENLKQTHHLVAEINGDIIQRPRWSETHLREGDRLELVTLFGGG